MKDGAVLAWGNNNGGQCTVPAAALSGVTQIACGLSHTIALKSDGSIIVWGDNTYCESADPTGVFSAIAGGAFHTIAIGCGTIDISCGSASSGSSSSSALVSRMKTDESKILAVTNISYGDLEIRDAVAEQYGIYKNNNPYELDLSVTVASSPLETNSKTFCVLVGSDLIGIAQDYSVNTFQSSNTDSFPVGAPSRIPYGLTESYMKAAAFSPMVRGPANINQTKTLYTIVPVGSYYRIISNSNKNIISWKEYIRVDSAVPSNGFVGSGAPAAAAAPVDGTL